MASYLALIAGRLKSLAAVVSSAGSADAGKIPALGATGKLDASVMPQISHDSLSGRAADDHPQYHTDARGDARYEPKNTNIQAHIASAANPHGTTAAQVGAYTTAQADALLAGKQPADADLTAVSGLSGVGFIVRTGDGQMVVRSLAYNLGIGITSVDGVSGAPVIANTDRGSAAVELHVANTDPHLQYHTDTRGDDRYLKLTGGTLTGGLTVPTCFSPNWYRSTGATGWYNETYAGGWYMTDTTFVRAYNSKAVRVDRGWDGVYGSVHLSGFRPSITLWDSDQSKKWLAHCVADSIVFYRAATGSEAATDWIAKVQFSSSGGITSAALAGTGNRAVYSDAGGALTNSASDRRLKKNIAPLGYGLAEVLRLESVWFWWKDAWMGSEREIGHIAQDVRNIIPEVVGRNADGMLSLDYAKLVPVLVQAIKELNERLSRANL